MPIQKQFYVWNNANVYSLMRKPRSQAEHEKYFNRYVQSQLGNQKLLSVFKPLHPSMVGILMRVGQVQKRQEMKDGVKES